MYQSTFGSKQQVKFNNEHEYYELLGFLAKSDRTSSLVLEHNEEQGAWGSEGRIQFFIDNLPFSANLLTTAGTGNIKSRVNCNEFIDNLINNHYFIIGFEQNVDRIRTTIPTEYIQDFDNGINL